MFKIDINNAECRTEFDFYREGSVKRETIQAGVTEFRSHFTVDSPAATETVERMIRLAKRGCFAEQLIQHPIPLRSTYSINGSAAEVVLD